MLDNERRVLGLSIVDFQAFHSSDEYRKERYMEIHGAEIPRLQQRVWDNFIVNDRQQMRWFLDRVRDDIEFLVNTLSDKQKDGSMALVDANHVLNMLKEYARFK